MGNAAKTARRIEPPLRLALVKASKASMRSSRVWGAAAMASRAAAQAGGQSGSGVGVVPKAGPYSMRRAMVDGALGGVCGVDSDNGTPWYIFDC